MPLLGYSQVAERRIFSRRGLLVCFAILSLVLSLASRTIQLNVADTVTTQSDSPKAKIQHLNRDAAEWTSPIAGFLLFWLVVVLLETAVKEKPLVPLHIDSCLYNRPPPLA